MKQDRRQPDLRSSDIYVQLYPQLSNCAILYSPGSRYAKSGPLHLKPTQEKGWKEEKFQRIKPFIDHAEQDPRPDSNSFYYYHVKDWIGFATALKLELS